MTTHRIIEVKPGETVEIHEMSRDADWSPRRLVNDALIGGYVGNPEWREAAIKFVGSMPPKPALAELPFKLDDRVKVKMGYGGPLAGREGTFRYAGHIDLDERYPVVVVLFDGDAIPTSINPAVLELIPPKPAPAKPGEWRDYPNADGWWLCYEKKPGTAFRIRMDGIEAYACTGFGGTTLMPRDPQFRWLRLPDGPPR